MAQVVARYLGVVEVAGSNPVTQTKCRAQFTAPNGNRKLCKAEKIYKTRNGSRWNDRRPVSYTFQTLLVVTLLLLMVYPQWHRTLFHPFFLAAPILRLV